jgi:spore germination protein GerM
MVPAALTGCRGRTVLGTGGPAEGKKHVAGQLAKTTSVASLPTASQSGSDGAPKSAATVWFTRAEGDKLIYVSQLRPSSAQFQDTAQALSFALTELLAGPGEQEQEHDQHPAHLQDRGHDQVSGQDSGQDSRKSRGLSSEIPPGTALIKVSEDKGTGDITIDLSRRFVQGGGTDSFEARLEQVKRTVEGPAGGRPVYLNVEGQRLTASGDGLEVKQPINVDTNPNSN